MAHRICKLRYMRKIFNFQFYLAQNSDNPSYTTVGLAVHLFSHTYPTPCLPLARVGNIDIDVDIIGTEPFRSRAQFAPRSESANRTLASSLPGTFAPWPFRSLALSLTGLLAPWNFRSLALSPPSLFAPGNESSMELSLRGIFVPGTFAPLMCISPFTYTDRNVLN